MSRTVYVNGEYLPEGEAKVSIFDRGFLFADGVYEVTPIVNGKLVDYDAHMERLDRSLGELRMAWPCTSRQACAPSSPAVIRVSRTFFRSSALRMARSSTKSSVASPSCT